MKKIVIFVLVVALILSVSLLAVGCETRDANGLIKLKTPKNLVVNGDAVSWSSVKNAKKYIVSIDGLEYESNASTYVVEVKEKGVYKLKVKASGDGVTYGESEYSKEIDYVQNERLNSPTLVMNGNVLSWDAVVGAEKYNVTILNRAAQQVGAVITTLEPKFVYEGEAFAKPDIYTANVVAIPADNSKEYIKSLASKLEYVVSLKLAAPTLNNYATGSSGDRITWTYGDYSNKFRIKITNNTTKEFVKETDDITASYFNYADLKLKDAGEYMLQIKAVGDGKVFLDSDYSVGKTENVLVKLAQLDRRNITIEKNTADDQWEIKWKISEDVFPDFTATKIYLKAPNAEGKEILGVVDTSIAKKNFDSEEVLSSGKKAYNYVYAFDKAFISKSDTNVWSYNKDDSYYGKFFDVYLQVENVDTANRHIPAESLKINDYKYLSYQRPNIIQNGVITPYTEISKVGEFAYMVQHANDLDKNKFKIVNNLDFGNYDIPTIDVFDGEINGGGLVLKNAVVDGKLNKNTDFGFIKKNNGNLNNINFVNIKIKAQNSAYVGMVAENYGDIVDCLVDGEVVGANGIVGAIAGKNVKLIKGCQSNASVSGRIVGGICGVNITENIGTPDTPNWTKAQVASCMSNGKVEAKEVIVKNDKDEVLSDGDKVAIINILGAINSGKNFDVEMLAGGLIGYNKGYLFTTVVGKGNPACSVGMTGKPCVHGQSVPHGVSVDYAAGAENTENYPECSVGTPGTPCNHGFEKAHGASVAYVKGQYPMLADASVYHCGSISNVIATIGDKPTAVSYIVSAGGLIGYNETTVESCYAGKMFSYDIKTDSVVEASGTGAVAGGFVGINKGEIMSCYSTSSVKAAGMSAGFVAKNSGNISASFSNRRIRSNDTSYRGFVSTNEGGGTIENCCFYSLENSAEDTTVGVTKIVENATSGNFEDQILKICIAKRNIAYDDGTTAIVEEKAFGQMGEVNDVAKGANGTKIQRGVYLLNMTYLETFKVSTRPNEGLSVYAYVVESIGDNLFKTTTCPCNAPLDAVGDKVALYPSAPVGVTPPTAYLQVKLIVTIK